MVNSTSHLYSGTTVLASRRGVIVGAGASAVAATCLFAPAVGLQEASRVTERARGLVYDARTAASFDAAHGIQGLSGVMVSNGRDICLTDGAGYYELPVSTGDFIFVVKPSQWDVTVGPLDGATRSYLHHPDGSRQSLRFGGIDPRGPLPAEINFGLTPSAENSTFEVIMLADTQPATDRELGYFRDETLASIATQKAAFGIHHGDVVGNTLALYERYLALIGATRLPWHHCPGNHDMNADAVSSGEAFDTWKRVIGPTHSAFQYGQATFLLLNNVQPVHVDIDRGKTAYRGYIGSDQLAFVRNVLRHTPRDHLIVVSMHIPLVNAEDPLSSADTTADRAKLLELLDGHPHAVSFSGHQHTTEHHYLSAVDQWTGVRPHHHHILNSACGSWWSGRKDDRGIPMSTSRDGCPKGYHILSVSGSSYTTKFVSTTQPGTRLNAVIVGEPESSAINPIERRAPCPILKSMVTHAELPSSRLVVDVFDGGPRSRVWCSLNGDESEPVELVRRARCDPSFVEQFTASPGLYPSWAAPSVSSHVWDAALPADLAPGVYRCEITAKDEYGTDLHTCLVFEVTP